MIISIKKPNSLNEIIDITIRINNRQYKKYIDKKAKIKTHSTRRFFKKDLMKLNIIKIKELRIKVYYFYKKKSFKKKLFAKSNKDNEKMNRDDEEIKFTYCERL